MKVLSLRCGQHHPFEGWFGSEAEFQDQLGRGLLTCPLCGDAAVVKLPSAPRLNLGATEALTPKPVRDQAETQSSGAVAVLDATTRPEAAPLPEGRAAVAAAAAHGAVLQALRQLMRQTEDVGTAFADQAREMHHGEREPKAIRGQATLKQTRELLEEGIDVLPLPNLPGLKEPLQ